MNLSIYLSNKWMLIGLGDERQLFFSALKLHGQPICIVMARRRERDKPRYL